MSSGAEYTDTPSSFLAMQALVRGNEPPTAIQEVAEYERWLFSIRAVLPPAVSLDDLGATLGRLYRDYAAAYPFVRSVDVVEWLYRELMAGKDWHAVRDSDPRNPAPAPEWLTLDFAAAADRLNAVGATVAAVPRRANARAQNRRQRRTGVRR